MSSPFAPARAHAAVKRARAADGERRATSGEAAVTCGARERERQQAAASRWPLARACARARGSRVDVAAATTRQLKSHDQLARRSRPLGGKQKVAIHRLASCGGGAVCGTKNAGAASVFTPRLTAAANERLPRCRPTSRQRRQGRARARQSNCERLAPFFFSSLRILLHELVGLSLKTRLQTAFLRFVSVRAAVFFGLLRSFFCPALSNSKNTFSALVEKVFHQEMIFKIFFLILKRRAIAV